MHLETAGEGPTNQVLQIHKSIASAMSIQAFFLFALTLLLDQLMDVVVSFYLFVCLSYSSLILKVLHFKEVK